MNRYGYDNLYMPEHLKKFDKVVQAYIKLWEAIREAARNYYEQLEESVFLVVQTVDDYLKAEADRKRRRALYKIDFTRPAVQHQVINRKPKNLIKKVIR